MLHGMTDKDENVAKGINDIFYMCCDRQGKISANFSSVMKIFWIVLNNNLSLCDIGGIYTLITNTANQTELNEPSFVSFFDCISTSKFPEQKNNVELLLENITSNTHVINSLALNCNYFEKNVIKTLLKFEIPLKRYFSAFASKSHNQMSLSWVEVMSQAITLDFEGFVSFCGSCSILPEIASLADCEKYFHLITTSYPLVDTMNLSYRDYVILYPQFQILILNLACDYYEKIKQTGMEIIPGLPLSPMVRNSQFMSTALIEFFKVTGIDRKPPKVLKSVNISALEGVELGYISLPNKEREGDQFYGYRNHNHESMLLRLEQLLEDCHNYIRSEFEEKKILTIQASFQYLHKDTIHQFKNINNPIVICDCVKVPGSLPEVLNQLLQAALANHNLSNFEDSLKFLEAARLQINENTPDTAIDKNRLELYIFMCKGNVYQSCGDDEQALFQYLQCFKLARTITDTDWESLMLNCLGIICYYNRRFDLSWLYFSLACDYRLKSYGENSIDTATVINNQGACLFSVGRKGESRAYFEKSWAILCDGLGHRSPRAIAIWKNLEKSRRFHGGPSNTPFSLPKPENAFVLNGGNFTIAAIPPPKVSKKLLKKTKKKKK